MRRRYRGMKRKMYTELRRVGGRRRKISMERWKMKRRRGKSKKCEFQKTIELQYALCQKKKCVRFL